MRVGGLVDSCKVPLVGKGLLEFKVTLFEGCVWVLDIEESGRTAQALAQIVALDGLDNDVVYRIVHSGLAELVGLEFDPELVR